MALAHLSHAASLRFYGHGGSAGDNFVFPDRVKILVEPPSQANVGAGDFTIEFFMRSPIGENPNPALSCGFGLDWVNSNIMIDRDRFNQGRTFGIGLLGGAVAFGASDEFVGYTLCGTTDLRDDLWHHVAVERRASDGRLRIWVDGLLDAEGPTSGGPSEDMSYAASAVPGSFCSPDGGSGSQSCQNSDPYLVFGAEKHGFQGINFSGWLDEVRLSNTIRYTASFPAPSVPFSPDGSTLALWHFDEGANSTLGDSTTGGSHGTIFVGGTPPAGPVWSTESPFAPVSIPTLPSAALIALAAGLAGLGHRTLRQLKRIG
ncbi:MAG: LamG domain-containing protein [Deltaproteobacteria bacterium]|nr:LamG domain-containing protein [Deltaproteobacteria bacterium]MBW2388953.1 LamG domain-containing protein [Deltaproteobacteria bacterium]MBW2725079.1 LamG domain-containing protein [Deltaproteobacteria bacterium]